MAGSAIAQVFERVKSLFEIVMAFASFPVCNLMRRGALRIIQVHPPETVLPGRQLLRRACTSRTIKPALSTLPSRDSPALDKLLQEKGYRNQDRVVLFDGVCNMCNSGINQVIELDKDAQFKFAALQGETGRALLRKYGCKEDLSTMVYVEEGKAYVKSDAPLMIGKRLGGSIGAVAWLAAMSVPRGLRNWIYSDIIAKYRYKIMGVRDSCRLSSPGLEKRFLD